MPPTSAPRARLAAELVEDGNLGSWQEKRGFICASFKGRKGRAQPGRHLCLKRRATSVAFLVARSRGVSFFVS